MTYELYYWSGIQGRGEFVRLALEDAGVGYVDVARNRGDAVLDPFLRGNSGDDALPFAPPFLRAGHLLVAQTATILDYLGQHLRLVPEGEAHRVYANQLQLTIADAVAEIHDSHHPIASSLYYENQQAEARRRAADLRERRLPKYLGYFEQVLARADGRHALGAPSYVDLSLFQLMTGLDYAFPRATHELRKGVPRLCALADAVAQRSRIAAYLSSPRRLPFNRNGIFRHYPELDG